MPDDFSLRITVMPPERGTDDEIAPTAPFERAAAAELAYAAAPRPLPSMKRVGSTAPRPKPQPKPATKTTGPRGLIHPMLATVPPLDGAPAPLPPLPAQPTSATPMPSPLPPPPIVTPLAPLPMLSPLPAPLPERDPMLDTITPLPGVTLPVGPRLPRATLAAVRATAPTEVMTSPRQRADAAANEPGSGPMATQASESAPTHFAAPPRPRRAGPTPTREERRRHEEKRAVQRSQWARDLLRKFQF